jgi:hypothetical protein
LRALYPVFYLALYVQRSCRDGLALPQAVQSLGQFEAESMGHWVAIEYFSGNRSPIVEKLRDKRFFTTSSGN